MPNPPSRESTGFGYSYTARETRPAHFAQRDTELTKIPKPKRVWALQAIVGLQLIGAIVGVVRLLVTGLPQISAGELVLGLAKPIIALVLLPVLLLSLQRTLPRPERVAPLSALAWALFTLGVWMTAVPQPLPPAFEAITFHDVTPEAARLGDFVVLAFGLGAMVWVVASLFVHRRTRAYLAGDAPDLRQ